ncbi:prefoldin subunit [Cystoisospora suis]|uniref:Prefoldin subunit n=1 Tax=Cystoisospora suis TaxID=483139 RepID=A0A2C6L3E4_9APIC|nr:prefoldin subunit [Cystoisospora suis]
MASRTAEAGPAGTNPAGSAPQTVNLSSLSLQQLVGVKDQLDAELQNLAVHLRNLRVASSRLQESRDAVVKFGLLDNTGSDKKGDEDEDDTPEVLVPLTSSVYVKGRLATRKKLLVDVGTGFLVEKNCADAKKGLDRKVAMVNEQVVKLEKILPEKQRQLEVTQNLIQQKYFQHQIALQEQMQQSAGRK